MTQNGDMQALAGRRICGTGANAYYAGKMAHMGHYNPVNAYGGFGAKWQQWS